MVEAYEPDGNQQLDDSNPIDQPPGRPRMVPGPGIPGPGKGSGPDTQAIGVDSPGMDSPRRGTEGPATRGRPERRYLSRLLQQLANNVRREQLETWFRSLDVARMDENEIEFSVTSQFVRDWLQKNFLLPLQQAVLAVDQSAVDQSADQSGVGRGDDSISEKQTGKRVVLSYREEDGWDSLRFAELDGGQSTGDLATGSQEEGGLSSPSAGSEANPSHSRLRGWGPGSIATGLEGVLNPIRRNLNHDNTAASPTQASPGHPVTGNRQTDNPRPRLNPNYTFDKFVVGACNRLGHASSIAIAENPGFAYNPLFVHGNVGLGKSHLLQAICHTIVKRSPDARVIYMSCEDFTNAFIQAIQTKQVEAFRQYYRDADVLVIDDVQFLAHKDKTQDEFFHTFNALYDAQKQIVLSSDRPPVEIPTIEERLVSRFKWGLVAEVEAPDFDTRRAIVQRKAIGRGTELPEDVARFLAERVSTNIRELEGAVIKVVGIAAITSKPITLGLAETCMRGLPVRNGQVSADDIMNLITSEFAISARELTGKSRTQMVSLPRQVAMYLIREHTENSLEDVGRIFGGRDHTTVLYAVNKIKERLGRDRSFKDLIESLSNRLLTRGFR